MKNRKSRGLPHRGVKARHTSSLFSNAYPPASTSDEDAYEALSLDYGGLEEHPLEAMAGDPDFPGRLHQSNPDIDPATGRFP